jgi:hypothetical protein
MTLIVPADGVDLARQLAVAFGGGTMWQTRLSADGQDPATHYISSGYLPPAWQLMVPSQTWQFYPDGRWVQIGSTAGDPVAIYQQAVALGVQVTLPEIEALFATADVTQQQPLMALDRLKLVTIAPPEPEDADA